VASYLPIQRLAQYTHRIALAPAAVPGDARADSADRGEGAKEAHASAALADDAVVP
jgi:hypothetical protein